MKTVIIGGHRIAYYLARMMISKGSHVYLINKDPDVCRELARRLSAIVIQGDGSKKEILDQIELSPEDIVVVLTNTDKDNLIISQMVRKYYGVEKIVTMVNDPDNVEIFRKLGVKAAISPTNLLITTIQSLLFSEEIENLLLMEEGKVVLLRLEIPETSPSAYKSLKEIPLPSESILGGIVRKDDFIIPRGDTQLLPGDRIFVICEPSVQTRVIKILVGE
ncbi:NAD-binding protein [Pseudothermotoga thermarum]|uniref:TrkA-N domain protein n=1 Tax=Pseudothermotoga thermarum DSM 5069 TaxID=688269 RepID=F7YW19_9THEM|nr:NAD-binding protein [Pseudothermotoga thermarum]AEH50506.1 TrkA-N domain protein [Pseudothermotoga thermarum DSM 5069]